MNTSELNAACHCPHFLGAFALDRLPQRLPQNACFIVNTHTSNLKGEHWIAVDADGLFDPLGIYYPRMLLQQLIRMGRKKIKFNRNCYQSPTSTLCGQYCLYYLHNGIGALKPLSFAQNDFIVVRNQSQCCSHPTRL